jgi:hypothetical protein
VVLFKIGFVIIATVNILFVIAELQFSSDAYFVALNAFTAGLCLALALPDVG